MNELSIDYRNLLPFYLHPTFKALDGRLKNLFAFQLLGANKGIHIDISIIALNIIAKCPRSDELFCKQREFFFINLLNEINPHVVSALYKVLDVAKEGFLCEFLNRVDSKKINYHTHQEIISIVDDFYSQSLPLLRKKGVEGSPQPFDLSTITQVYEKLMCCQTYFILKNTANHFLAILPSRLKWKQETYDCFFNLLGVQYDILFNEFEKVELSKAIFRLHSPMFKELFMHSSEIDIREFIAICHQLKHQGGEEFLQFCFISLSKSDEPSLNATIEVFNQLLSQISKKSFFTFINAWSNQKFCWVYLLEFLKVGHTGWGLDQSFFYDDVQDRLERFRTDSTITEPLSDADLHRISLQYQIIDRLCKEHRELRFNQLMNLAHQIRETAKKGPIKEDDRLLLIALGCLAIRIEFSITPYSTQVLALLGILLGGESRQAQVKTGEGKSMIVALFAFVMAMECRSVDIITSARYLATRDYNKFDKFFKRCEITSGHICYDDKSPDFFAPQILYGPAFDFEFAWMEDLLWGKKLYQQRLLNPYVKRNFDVVCVDESDNLLIDSVKNGARLGSPSDTSYDWVYAPILSFVSQNRALVEKSPDLLLPKIRGYLHSHIQEQYQRASNRLTDKQLHTWMNSAYRALFELDEERDYVVKSKRDEEGHEIKVIQIVDLQTGRISESSRWSNGTHEFLEVKHDIVVAKESITPISLSHAVFYRFYSTITALTGTAERFQTHEIYQIKSFDVPPHLPLKRVDHPPIIAKNKKNHYDLIVQSTRTCLQAGRPCLILCPTIQETQSLAARMKEEGFNYMILNEIQEELEHIILDRAGAPGRITIATNTAGRGTDIILTSDSLQNGGLHVIVSFYAESKRIEDQAIGRSGRQGQPGSSQVIINSDDPLIKDFTSKHEGGFLDHEIIQLLEKQRQLREKSQASTHIAFADLERFLAEKTNLFFESFRNWTNYVDQNIVVEKFAQKLSNIRLKPSKAFNFDHLCDADLQIAEECMKLLLKKSEMLSWKVFLQKVVDRNKQRIIHDWVTIFFEPAENQLKNTGLSINALRSQLEDAFKAKMDLGNLDNKSELFVGNFEHYFHALDVFMESTKEEITQRFLNHKIQWEKYLAKDGSGLFYYLHEITKINFISSIFRKY